MSTVEWNFCPKLLHIILLNLLLKQSLIVNVSHQLEVTLLITLILKVFNNDFQLYVFFELLLGE